MFSKTISTAKSKHLMRWLLRQETRLHAWLHALILQIAVSSAYQKFAERHPRWAASLFDEYFLRGQAAPLLARYLHAVERPTARELANVWFEQFGSMMPTAIKEQGTEVTDVAGDFLCVLDAELGRLGA